MQRVARPPAAGSYRHRPRITPDPASPAPVFPDSRPRRCPRESGDDPLGKRATFYKCYVFFRLSLRGVTAASPSSATEDDSIVVDNSGTQQAEAAPRSTTVGAARFHDTARAQCSGPPGDAVLTAQRTAPHGRKHACGYRLVRHCHGLNRPGISGGANSCAPISRPRNGWSDTRQMRGAWRPGNDSSIRSRGTQHEATLMSRSGEWKIRKG